MRVALAVATAALLAGCHSTVRVPRLGFDSRRAGDAALFGDLLDEAQRTGHEPHDIDRASGRFTVDAHSAPMRDTRFVIQCSRDGFVTVSAEGARARVVDDRTEVPFALRTEWARLVDALERTGASVVRSGGGAESWPADHGAAPLHHAVRQNGEDGGLVAAALVVFDVGWLLGLLGGILDEALGVCVPPGGVYSTAPCGSWPLMFVPVAGSTLATTLAFDPGTHRETFGTVTAFGAPSSGLQIVGLFMLAAALANQTHGWETPRLQPQGATLSLVPSAPSADAGGSLVLRF